MLIVNCNFQIHKYTHAYKCVVSFHTSIFLLINTTFFFSFLKHSHTFTSYVIVGIMYVYDNSGD